MSGPLVRVTQPSTVVVTSASKPVLVVTGSPKPVEVTAPTGLPGQQGEDGPPGPPGPKGDEGGTPVVALPYSQWPPVNPQPDTLYLRLAP